MTPVRERAKGLQLDEDMDFQRRSWIFQRVGWTLMLAAMGAAAAGLLGPGPYSRTAADSPGGLLRAEFNRLERAESNVDVAIRVRGGASRDGLIRLSVPLRVIERARLIRVDPEPESVETGSDQLTFVFRTATPETESRIFFRLQTAKAGRLDWRIGLAGGADQVEFSQRVYP